ncbi:VirB8/TrbF family protein [Variovorax sp. NFACC27]|uniref:Bacterial virulence protein VirB8 domain-containing protein n=1 Tax=Variovorax gossypii TaxID=1679495 RepID=A0A3S0J4G3_9BURK|nr:MULTISPECIES: VirB8/TrbF family protein [Variovorax]MDP9606112.1 type IV secretion system protein VirB8 [Variovorax paradoxus]SEF35162.1 type IV secretion system protein VirB8 [Variovorax sp. NFACC28]SEG98797.1 type IV secretion system protein VirB8 [Variovorax sp. NFACC29]SFE14327.1 type IV secretion system protein VirB8 [Variovorax sp. NFACC26]SFH19675.1 type IV secretion system protein VirB8 [Variovorax sp. NFACC27]
MRRDAAPESYLLEAQSWELDRARRAEHSAKVAWIVASVSIVIAVLAAAAVAGLTPLKQPVPVLIRVDSSSGIVDIVPTYEGTADIEQLVTRNLLQNYVIARERYFYGTAEADYELVAAQNSPRLNQEWASLWATDNPASPLNAYKDGTSIRTQVRSITFLKLDSGKDRLAQVRFTRSTRAGGNGEEQASHWVSTIDFAYVRPSKDDKTRSLNPLGFRVVEYRREPEVATMGAAPGKQDVR